MEVVVFHRRRSSHLFYTLHVFSQCQTRVKLNHTNTDLRTGHFRPGVVAAPPGFVLRALVLGAGFRQGLARTISRVSSNPTDTFARVTTAPRRGLATGLPWGSLSGPFRLPRTRLSRPRPPTVRCGRWTSLNALNPIKLQGLLSPLILPSPFPWLWFR